MLTDFLKLFKADPTDGDNTFNITTMLNDNWDKLNAWAKGANAATGLYTTTGAPPNYTATIPNLQLIVGTRISVKFHVASNVPATLKLNNGIVGGIKKPDGTNYINLKAGIYTLVFDGANFTLQGEGASGNATASELLSGKTASTDAGEIVGSMPNLTKRTIDVVNHASAMSVTVEASDPRMGILELPNTTFSNLGYIDPTTKFRVQLWGLIPENIAYGKQVGQYAGYGTGHMEGTFTSDANAVASDLIVGKTAYAKGAKVTGTIPVLGGEEYNGWRRATVGTPSINGRVHLQIPLGAYLVAGQAGGLGVFADDPEFISNNIRAGIDLFGLVGTMPDGTGLRKMASGTAVAVAGGKIQYTVPSEPIAAGGRIRVDGLSFKPSVIVVSEPSAKTIGVFRKSMLYGSGDFFTTVYNNGWNTGASSNLREYDSVFAVYGSFGLGFAENAVGTTFNWIAFE